MMHHYNHPISHPVNHHHPANHPIHHPGNPHGISMHKGYAFVQFTNPFDARSACMGEDGRNVFGQILDVNLVAEPKPHQIGKKRPNVAKSAGDWEQFYDSYNAGAAVGMGIGGPRLTPPLKRPRMMIPMRQQQQRAQSPKKVVLPGLEDLRTYSSPDILICGNCRELFSNLADFIEHRKQYCKLRFTCKCSSFTLQNGVQQESAALMCALCKENFSSSWDLMVHAQAAHMVNIYQLSSKENITVEKSVSSNSTTGESKTLNNGDEAEAENNSHTDTIKENGVSETEDSVDMMNGSSSPEGITPQQPEDVLVK
uniref:Basic-leucine zipper transcription factor O n=1 Tax=Hirondellea gigas TaxID=1518452 RepID=A0A6A7FWZ0_9CRUS